VSVSFEPSTQVLSPAKPVAVNPDVEFIFVFIFIGITVSDFLFISFFIFFVS
jgi:hypothetical protein